MHKSDSLILLPVSIRQFRCEQLHRHLYTTKPAHISLGNIGYSALKEPESPCSYSVRSL
jgi:hypothetical protein